MTRYYAVETEMRDLREGDRIVDLSAFYGDYQITVVEVKSEILGKVEVSVCHPDGLIHALKMDADHLIPVRRIA